MKAVYLDSKLIDKKPNQQTIDQWSIEYKFYAKPENQGKTVVLLLGGAFQTFMAFRRAAEMLYEEFPVLLVDLPSQGNNRQLAAELEVSDLADLLRDFLEQHGIEQVCVLGLSYGAFVASVFATRHPTKVKQLMLSGITQKRRKAIVLMLEYSIEFLRKNRMEEFAVAASSYLLNYARIQETQISRAHQKMLIRSLKRLDNNDKQRYEQNTRRLLNFRGFTAYPQCEILVTTGEYDHFTLPHENAEFADQCPQGKFALIRNADHLSNLEREAETTELMMRFFTEQSLENIQGVNTHIKQRYNNPERRTLSRLTQRGIKASLQMMGANYSQAVESLELSMLGCSFRVSQVDPLIDENNRELQLYLPDIEAAIFLQIHNIAGTLVRAMFLHNNLDIIRRLEEYCRDIPLLRAAG